MLSKKSWDVIMFLMVISFVSLIIFANIHSFDDKNQTERVDSSGSTKQATVELKSVNKFEDVPSPIYISTVVPFLSQKEMNEKADLIIVGLITDMYVANVEKEVMSDPNDASGNTVKLNIPYIIYDISIIESVKSPKSAKNLTKKNNIKVKCIYAISPGFDPSDIKQNELYKFYLVSGNDESYSLVNGNGIQKYTEN